MRRIFRLRVLSGLPVLFLRVLSILALAAGIPARAAEPVPWGELALSIEEDRHVSSDGATICLVRVVNHGRGTWQGRDVRFEARAIREGRIAARARGRFGLTLGPHETLETAVGFTGHFDRLEVGPAEKSISSGSGRSRGGSGKKRGASKKKASRKKA